MEREAKTTFHAVKHREGGAVKVAAVEERAGPRLDPPNILWFFGAFAIAFGVYALLQTIPNDQSGLWRFLAAIGFFTAFVAAAVILLRDRSWVPGGLAASLAVGSFPAVAIAFLELAGLWPHDPFLRPFVDFSGYWLGVAVSTALVGAIAFAVARFPFVIAVSVAAVLVGSQLLTPAFEESPSADDRVAVALAAGAGLVIVGVFLDAFGRRKEAFWFHALGWLSVASGLVVFTFESPGNPDRGWVPMLAVSVLMLIVAGPIRRATWAIYGVVGYYASISHYLLKELNESRWPFALLALLLGVSIFALGSILNQYGHGWAQRFVRRPPPALGP